MSLFTYIKSHVVLASTLTVGVACVAVIAGRAATQKTAPPNTTNQSRVTLVAASSFRNGSFAVLADGTIQSHSQADLRSQMSAPVAVINTSIGDTVYAGEIIMELQNSDIRAQLAQAQASLVLAEGQYGLTRQSAIDRVRSAYLAADSAVHSQIDQLIVNTSGVAQPLLFTYATTPAQTSAIHDKRSDLTTAFAMWKPAVDALTASSTDGQIHNAIVQSQTNLDKVSALLDDISAVLNNAANTSLQSSLATVNGLIANVTTARTSISGASAGLSAAATSITGGDSGSTPVQAQISVAEAGVNNLRAQLAKTIVTSPITGKISALPLRVGELASPGALLATVVGDSSNLEVKAFASGDDLPRLHVGQAVTIDGTAKGIISNVAPSVDSSTKKAEVDVDVTNSSASGLVVGQNVSISIQTSNTSGTNASTYILPIQDVKIIPGNAFVYTVDADSKIMSNPVTLGTIQGDFVEVTAGLTDDMKIVTPVYELDPGQTVTVQ